LLNQNRPQQGKQNFSTGSAAAPNSRQNDHDRSITSSERTPGLRDTRTVSKLGWSGHFRGSFHSIVDLQAAIKPLLPGRAQRDLQAVRLDRLGGFHNRQNGQALAQVPVQSI
jgi:hypothetical protein